MAAGGAQIGARPAPAGPPKRPRLRSDLRVRREDEETVVLSGEGRHFVLRGAAFGRVLPVLDGTRDAAQVVGAADGLTLLEVTGAIHRLNSLGVLVEGVADGDDARAAFWDAAGVGSEAAERRLAAATVALHAVGDADVAPIREQLERLGLEIDETGIPCVVATDHLDPELESLNAAFLRTDRPWLLARITGSRPWLGPYFDPPTTGCWACMADRLRANLIVEQHMRRRSRAAEDRRQAALPTTVATAAAIVASQLAALAAGAPSPLRGAMVTLDLRDLETARHEVIRRPQCEACGEPVPLDPGAPIVVDHRAVEVLGLGERGERLADTRARLSPHVSPLLGTTRGLERLADAESPLHVCVAGENQAVPFERFEDAEGSLRARNAGKGTTALAAEVGAICESLERWCGKHTGDEPVVRGTLAERGERAVDPRDLLHFSERQYATRRDDQPPNFNQVFEPFDPDVEIDWSPAWSMTGERTREVPAAFCWYGYPLEGPKFCRADSNGCAAGSTAGEALLQGTLELIERDSVALWWYPRARRPGVALASFDDPFLAAAERWLDERDRELWALDLTSDLGVPAFAALSRRGGAGPDRVLLGFGAHLDPAVATRRAVAELGQMLPMVEGANERPSTPQKSFNAELGRWLDTVSVESEPWLAPDPSAVARRTDELPSLARGDLAADVGVCVERLRDAGLELLAVDQSRPDVELSVVKAIVPGLRHFWRRLGPGRLYDVPPRLGWVDGPPREEELNPWGMFL